MHSAKSKSLLIFIRLELSDREHMIERIHSSFTNRGKSFLASIVLALFVFGVVQMLTSA